MQRVLMCDLRVDKSLVRPVFLKKGTVINVEMVDRFEPFCFITYMQDGTTREERHFPLKYLFECTRKLNGIDLNTETAKSYVDSQVKDLQGYITETNSTFSSSQWKKLFWFILGMMFFYHVGNVTVSAIFKAIGI